MTASARPAGDAQPLLRVSGVRKAFGENVVLDDLDLEVAEHGCVVLIGASGSGKSTLLRAIDLLEDVDDGSIELRGVDLADPWVDADAARARMGMVFQSYNLFGHMSVLDNVTLAPRLVHGRDKAEAEAAAVEMLTRVGLAEKVRAYPDQLSGGQQQRAAIARALVNGPELLLLDEVTSALDPELVGEVLELLAELRNEGMTMLIATHEMAFARDVADQVCFLHEGRVHEAGTPAQVLGDPQRVRTREFLARLHA
ncbi:amino acid ABC transporter ATP-binding protein [Ruania halotolerans]|uniref:amino acid ABC transporter ATP-binding protein n=1 Tax=Ruania halotolerans TaxID=2897773 RepID=UPI001E522113|nr:amino acid ABC transporter ATP-binding protein [Ruania halotolerans]UFU05602.1 amino acid ABC transporter ATP-binding protein [Ruania halotolerans]